MHTFKEKKRVSACVCQKKAVILQPETENDSPTEHFWFDF